VPGPWGMPLGLNERSNNAFRLSEPVGRRPDLGGRPNHLRIAVLLATYPPGLRPPAHTTS